MRHSMSEIQDPAQTGLLLILTDHIRFDFTGSRYHMRRRIRFQIQNGLPVLFQKRKKVRIVNHAILDDFSHPRSDFAFRQRPHQVEIHKYRFRLIKGTDQIFPQRMIDRHLSANTRIHLCQQVGSWINGTPRI